MRGSWEIWRCVLVNWRLIGSGEELPKPHQPILMKGESGYIPPNEVAIISGYYDPNYADPWRDWGGDGLQDCGVFPTEWIPLEEIYA